MRGGANIIKIIRFRNSFPMILANRIFIAVRAYLSFIINK